ncbi:MAG: polyprenyl synthetase family protein [Candidatus Dormibacteria bacterium]
MSIVAALRSSTVDPLEGMVEAELTRLLDQDPASVRLPMEELVAAGGKRLRPLMTMLSAQLGPAYDPRRAASLAAVLELIHSATLVHDDLVDGSAERRGRPTVGASLGPRMAIAVGDYYFARSAGILAELADDAVTLTVMRNVREVCRAQVLETNVRGASGLDQDVYMEIASGKTAALLVAACVGGAQLAGAPAAVHEALRAYATGVGLAFQMVDDVIDFEAGGTGKPVGQDLRAGVWSLPVIVAAEDPSVGARLARMLESPTGLGDAIDLVRGSGALGRVRHRAEALAQEAARSLDAVPTGDARTRLIGLAELAAGRRS